MTQTTIRVSIGQIDCVPGDPKENGRTAQDVIRRSSDEGATVVVLPEMADLGYVLPDIPAKATTLADNPFVDAIQNEASRHGVTVLAGVTERVDNTTIYNTIAVIAPDGALTATYRKTHLFGGERKYLAAGDDLTVTDIAGVRSGIMNCYDIRFPEMARALMTQGAKVIYVPAAFPLVRVNHWRTLTEARALENQVYLVAANRVGDDGPGLATCGRSRVIDPYGIVIADSPESQERLVIANLDLEVIEKTRAVLPALKDRRPDLYNRWGQA